MSKFRAKKRIRTKEERKKLEKVRMKKSQIKS